MALSVRAVTAFLPVGTCRAGGRARGSVATGPGRRRNGSASQQSKPGHPDRRIPEYGDGRPVLPAVGWAKSRGEVRTWPAGPVFHVGRRARAGAQVTARAGARAGARGGSLPPDAVLGGPAGQDLAPRPRLCPAPGRPPGPAALRALTPS